MEPYLTDCNAFLTHKEGYLKIIPKITKFLKQIEAADYCDNEVTILTLLRWKYFQQCLDKRFHRKPLLSRRYLPGKGANYAHVL